MKKRITFIVAMLILALGIVACGGSDAGGDTGNSAELESQVANLEAQLDAANEAVAAAEAAAADAAAAAGSAAAPVEVAGGGNTLQAVLDRGVLKCGVPAGSSPGFGFLEADGSWSGQDVDYCRVVAAAVLGDKDAVEFRSTTGTDRFPVLQSGEVDLLVRQTTWTLSRDTSLGFDFGPTIFYDGQGMMVRKDSGIESLEDLDGGSVCVATGTTTEKNLADVFRLLDIQYEAVVFEDQGDTTRSAFEEGRCDGYTTDKSGLVSNFALFANPDEYMILSETMSKEPLGPLVRHGDNNWGDIVNWSTYCTFQAEELGINSANVDDFVGSDDPVVLNTLGQEGDLGQAMGINNDFCYQIIKQMGNYEEIYLKNLGPDTQFNLPRGVNTLWTDGGLLYSPPFR
jgi:general L-amino acid transport system substrate-binding protein